MVKKTVKSKVDWERVECDYRAGSLSLRDMAAIYGVSHTAIRKRANKYCWDKDLKPKINARADTLVSRAEVSGEVSNTKLETEQEVINANATAIANIRLSHRKDIRIAKDSLMVMMGELDDQIRDTPAYNKLAELLAGNEELDLGKLQGAFYRVISLPQRIENLRKITDTLKSLVTMEREAWGINMETTEEVKEVSVSCNGELDPLIMAMIPVMPPQ